MSEDLPRGSLPAVEVELADESLELWLWVVVYALAGVAAALIIVGIGGLTGAYSGGAATLNRRLVCEVPVAAVRVS